MKINRRSAGRLIAVTLILSALSLTGCVKKPAVVLQGDSQILEVRAGQPAPVDGFLLSPAALVDLMECCNDQLAQ
jgi:hypothetical protein